MKKKTIYILTALILSGCTTSEVTDEIAEISEFKIDMQPERIDDNMFKVVVKTNFPDDTRLTISANREYRRINNDEIYAGSLYSNPEAIVKNGMVEFSFKTNDSEWIKRYEKIQTQNGQFDNTLTDIDYSTVKDSIEISVLFTPKAKQSPATIQATGLNGENLTGEGVEEYADFKVLNKRILIFDKYSK